MAAVSKNVTPRSSARWIARIDSSSSRGPYDCDILMQPRPTADTSGPPLPSCRFCITASMLEPMLSAPLLRHDTDVILKQFYLNCLAHASYIIADADGGAAAVVDPQRDVDQLSLI